MKPFRLRWSEDALAMPIRRGRWLCVGEWMFDPGTDELSRGADCVPLDPRSAAVLLHLARHAGQVVARDELLAEIAPDGAMRDGALTPIITKLRKALGDLPKRPSYVETIPKRGYRLIAPVTWVSSDPGLRPAAKAGLLKHLRERRREYALFALVALAIAAVLLTAGWQAHRNGDNIDALVREAASVRAIDTLPVVIVRPFEAEPTDRALKLYARGFEAHLVAELSRMHAIRVIAGGPLAPQSQAIAHRSARYIVSGEARRVRDGIGLQIKVSEAQTNRSLLSREIDGAADNLTELQTELGTQVAHALASKIADAGLHRDRIRYTANEAGYKEFLHGQTALGDAERPSFERAREHFWRAVQFDPLFAHAYAALALTYAAEWRHGTVPNTYLDRATEFARTAEQIDASIPEVHWVLAWANEQRRNYLGALKHLRKSLALNPSFADAYALTGSILLNMGRSKEAISVLQTALVLKPDEGHLYPLLLGRAYFQAGYHAQAVTQLRNAIERSPTHVESHLYLAAALAQAGEKEAASWAVEELRVLRPDLSIAPWLAMYSGTEPSQLLKLSDTLRSLGL